MQAGLEWPGLVRAYLDRPNSAREPGIIEARSLKAYISRMGKLYLVGTPIGNLEDITLRAARVLGEVSLVAAEDTRVSRRLLNHLGIRVAYLSCNEHNWRQRLPELLRALESGDVALVTDAGMPAVSDPGADLVAALSAQGVAVEVIPGPSAVTTALALSGLPSDAFLFLGFLPRRSRQRRERLAQVSNGPDTLVIFEAPHRLHAALADLLDTLGDRQVVVCRELTKRHEEAWRGSISQAIEHFAEPRGEFVLVVAGADAASPNDPEASREQARLQLAALKESGGRARESVAEVTAATGLPRSEVYRLWLETRDSDSH